MFAEHMSQRIKRGLPKPATPPPQRGKKTSPTVPLAVAGLVIVVSVIGYGISAGWFDSHRLRVSLTQQDPNNVTQGLVTLPPVYVNTATQGNGGPPEQPAQPELGPSEKAGFLQNHANDLLKQGKYAEAVAEYQAAVKLTPEDEDAHYNLAFALAKSADHEGAKHEYEEALRIYPDYTEAHNNLGNVLLSEGKIDDALTHFKAALALTADDPLTQNNMGHALALQKKPTEAIPFFKEALRLKADFTEARNNLAVAYLVLKQPNEAIAEFEQILKTNPDFDPALKGMARARKLLGQ